MSPDIVEVLLAVIPGAIAAEAIGLDSKTNTSGLIVCNKRYGYCIQTRIRMKHMPGISTWAGY